MSLSARSWPPAQCDWGDWCGFDAMVLGGAVGEEIDAQRIFLRPVQLGDVNERYLEWMNDPVTNRYLETRFRSQRLEDIRAFVQSKIGSSEEKLYAICLRGTREHIGNIKLGRIKSAHRSGELSFFIGSKVNWGKGFASEAILTLTRHAFRGLGLLKLRGGVYEENSASARAFERCGYVLEGRLRSEVDLDGRRMDLLLYGMKAEEFVGR